MVRKRRACEAVSQEHLLTLFEHDPLQIIHRIIYNALTWLGLFPARCNFKNQLVADQFVG